MKIKLVKLLADTKQTFSMGEGRRFISTGVVTLNEEKIDDINAEVEIKSGDVICIGKKRKITITDSLLDDLSHGKN